MVLLGLHFRGAFESSSADESQDARQLTDVEPCSVFGTNVNDDSADLSKIASQHQIATKRARDVSDRIMYGIAGTQPVRRLEFDALVTANHGVQDFNRNELPAATTAVEYRSVLVGKGVKFSIFAAWTGRPQ
jgi:hypothetical protein